MEDSPKPNWQRGDIIVERHINQAGIRGAMPLWIWSDDDSTTITYLPVGSTYQGLVGLDGEPDRSVGVPKKRVSRTWQDHPNVRIFQEGDEYALYVFFTDEWKMLCWYVNFQAPVQRHAMGLDTTDWTLDLLIAPDLSGHRWKDVDEFEERIEAGIYPRSELERLKDIGRGVLKDVEARKWPFDEPWQDWRPPADWGPLELPVGWDRVDGGAVP